jgi:hypothetical protein
MIMSEPVTGPAVVSSRAPMHLWIVGVLALLWSLMGVFDYLATQFQWEPYMSEFSAEQLEYFYAFPSWMVAAWALAVWCGLGGSVGLLLRRSWAVWMFVVSLIGLALTTFYSFVLSSGAEIMGTGPALFTVVIWVAAILLLLYARKQAQNGVLV